LKTDFYSYIKVNSLIWKNKSSCTGVQKQDIRKTYFHLISFR